MKKLLSAILAAVMLFSAVPVLAEDVAVLDGRLMVEINGNYEYLLYPSTQRLSFDGGNMIMTARELYVKSAGDLENDAANLGFTPCGDITRQNGIELVPITPYTKSSESYLVKASDDFLIYITFNYENMSYDDFKTAVRSLMSTLDMGETQIDVSEKRASLYSIDIDCPEGFAAYYTMGVDYDLWTVKQIVSSDADFIPSVSIYRGYAPSYSEEYNGESAVGTLEGEFLGSKIEWQIYDGYMQALDTYGDVSYHLYGYAKTDEQREMFAEIIGNIGENDNTFPVVTVSVNTCDTFGSPTFSDVDYSEEFGAAVAELAADGIISGYEEGTFRPDNIITRAEFVKLAVTAFGLESRVGAKSSFADVPQSHWAYSYISIAYTLAAISGDYFSPDSGITEGEAAEIIYALARACGIAFEDGAGFEGVTEYMTRARAAVMIYDAMSEYSLLK